MKPLRGGSSRQSIVAPRSFSTLSAATTIGEVALVLDEVVAAGEADRIERQRAAVFAVG